MDHEKCRVIYYCSISILFFLFSFFFSSGQGPLGGGLVTGIYVFVGVDIYIYIYIRCRSKKRGGAGLD